MNYGRRTTKTTTHRDTPLSATPEPRFAMFQNLDEITVTPSKEQIKSYTGKWNKEADILNRDSNEKGQLNLESSWGVRNLNEGKNADYLPTNRRLKEIKGLRDSELLDYGNPADKLNLKKISTSRANLEKAKRDNKSVNKTYNSYRKMYLNEGGED